MPADHRNGVTTVRALSRELILAELIDGRLRERFVAKAFGANRVDEFRHDELD